METALTPPAPPRALFFGLDGTLLPSRKDIGPRTLAALKALRASGVPSFMATARPPHVERQLPLEAMGASFLARGVFMNGAVVRVEEGFEYVPMDRGAAADAVALARSVDGLNAALQMPGNAHAFLYPLPAEEYRLWGLRGIRSEEIVPFPAAEEPLPEGVSKIVFFSRGNWLVDGRDLGSFHGELSRSIGDRATIYISDRQTVVQAVGKGVSKRSGIERVAARLGLRSDEIAVFGDDVNDIEMLSSFPRSFAMGNALDEAKAAASRVIGHNDEEGIADLLAELYPDILG